MRTNVARGSYLSLGAACLPLVAFALSCGGTRQKTNPVVDTIRPLFVEELKLAVTISPDANQQSPVAVDLVMIYDPNLLDPIAKLAAKDWFVQREQLQRDFPDGFQLWRWEWVPGQQISAQRIRFNPRRVKGTLLFANYFLPGTHRAKVDPLKQVSLVLGEETFSLRNP